ncbi:MAG: PAS domain S-box protein [Chitinophagaceae bacterium]|nr:PAS domain S-box protein [Chitinophagaceae bacterium]
MLNSDKELFILVIEDNAGDFVLIEDYLKEYNPSAIVQQAGTFARAKELLSATSPYDAILLDLSLPDGSGEDVVKEIVLMASSSPVIVLTGYLDRKFGIRTLSMGISDYLFKEEVNASQLYKSIDYSMERKRIGERLRESEEKYRNLFHLSPMPMWVFDSDTLKFLDVNEAAIRHYGYNREEFLASNIIQIRPKEDAEMVKEIVLNNKRKTSIFYKGLVRHTKKNGDIIFVKVESNKINFDGKDARLILATDVTETLKVEKALKMQDQEITKAIIKAQEKERFQIGGELHDNVNQILATAQLALGMTNNPSSSQAEVWIDKSKEYIKLAMAEIRRLSHSLAPASFQENSLKEAFDTLLYSINVNNKYEIIASYNQFSDTIDVSNDIQLNLFRILQEQLKNILKYSNATRIEISVKMEHGRITMRIFDNGKGFDIDRVKRGIGLRNIKKRTELFMGTCKIHSSIGNGCEIIIEIPVSEYGTHL